jgi:hypothetical protein
MARTGKPRRTNRFELEMFKAFGRHDVRVVELEGRTFSVECGCGFAAPAPYGEVHALQILERHLRLYGLVPDKRVQ